MRRRTLFVALAGLTVVVVGGFALVSVSEANACRLLLAPDTDVANC
jgi:hypothetical protein